MEERRVRLVEWVMRLSIVSVCIVEGPLASAVRMQRSWQSCTYVKKQIRCLDSLYRHP